MSNWPTSPLQSLMCKPIQYGIVQRGADVKGGTPCIRVTDLSQHGVNADGLARVSPEINHKYRKTVLFGGEVLFALRGEIGRTAVVPRELAGANIHRGVARLAPGSRLHSGYLRAVLSGNALRRRVMRMANGSALKELSIDQLRRLEIPVPPLAIQQEIVGVISRWDGMLATLDDLLAAKRRFRRGLLQELLTGKRRLPGFEGVWPKAPIASIAREVSARNGAARGLPVLSCTKHEGLVDSLGYFGRRVYGEDLSAYKQVARGQFAYATNHLEEGSIGLLRHHERGLVSPMYTVFEVIGEVDPEFLHMVLKSEQYRQLFASATSASVNRRGSVRWGEFSRLKVPIPSMEEQGAVANLARLLDKEIDLLVKYGEALGTLKRGLMEDLLTGKRGVPVAVRA